MAIVLGIDASARVAHSALVEDNSILGQVSAQHQGNAEALAELISQCSQLGNCSLDKITSIAVATGPGSFTGIRTGIATAQGLGMGLKVPVIGVSGLLASLVPWLTKEGVYLPYQQSAGEECFYAVFSIKNSNTVTADIDKPFFDFLQIARMSQIKLCMKEDIKSVLAHAEDEFEASGQAFEIGVWTEEESKKIGNPAVHLARAIRFSSHLVDETDDSGMHLQFSEEGAGLQPLYIKKAAYKTVAERRAAG